jgi:hypothetical protein
MHLVHGSIVPDFGQDGLQSEPAQSPSKYSSLIALGFALKHACEQA